MGTLLGVHPNCPLTKNEPNVESRNHHIATKSAVNFGG